MSTRIQTENRERILAAALEAFADQGFRGTTLDRIAQLAGLSKPNLLYYFPSKAAVHLALLEGLIESWLDPLKDLDPDGEPLEQILAYVRRKLEMSRTMPRESRLFANEVLRGAPDLTDWMADNLKPLVEEKAAIIKAWSAEGRLPPVHPYHLLFSIWALTQHYADFAPQVAVILGPEDPYPEAEAYLVSLFRARLSTDL